MPQENQLDGRLARVLGLICGPRGRVRAGRVACPAVLVPARKRSFEAPRTDGLFTPKEKTLLLSGRRKLLLADDSPTVRKVVEMFFEEEGYEVVAVGGGEEAMRELEGERPPDVLLADAVMPGPDGYMLCERVKRDARLGRVPVVLLVGDRKSTRLNSSHSH